MDNSIIKKIGVGILSVASLLIFSCRQNSPIPTNAELKSCVRRSLIDKRFSFIMGNLDNPKFKEYYIATEYPLNDSIHIRNQIYHINKKKKLPFNSPQRLTMDIVFIESGNMKIILKQIFTDCQDNLVSGNRGEFVFSYLKKKWEITSKKGVIID